MKNPNLHFLYSASNFFLLFFLFPVQLIRSSRTAQWSDSWCVFDQSTSKL
jgi:hypothetical protein